MYPKRHNRKIDHYQRPLSNIDFIHFAKKYIPHFRGVFMRDLLPEAPKSRECGIVNIDNFRSRGTHWVAYNKNKNNIHYFDSCEILGI